MSDERTHYVTTTDGVTIGGTVRGQGPPLVFLHGMLGDGDLDWDLLTSYLKDRFTCHLPSQRSRGLSDDHADLGYGRQVEDFLTYIDSIDQPTGLVGWSGGVWPTLHAAAQSDGVSAMAAIEPESVGLANEEQQAAFGNAVERATELVAKGEPTAAVRPLADFVFDGEEVAKLEDVGYLEATARYIPVLLDFIGQLMAYEGTTAEAPAVLAEVSAPLVVLKGSDTKLLAASSARHVAEHVSNARLQEVPGAGHAAPLTHPKALADVLIEFFEPLQRPV